MDLILSYSQKHFGVFILGYPRRINFSDDLTDDAKNRRFTLNHQF